MLKLNLRNFIYIYIYYFNIIVLKKYSEKNKTVTYYAVHHVVFSESSRAHPWKQKPASMHALSES